jgi:predicted unusual protein kinase regulating ubiquinone biosynthesis (AarF/ABC1/UbiB family)
MLNKQTTRKLTWQKERPSSFARQCQLFGVTFKLLYSLWWDKVTSNNSPRQRQRRAKWLVAVLLDLGPTFIKIGQAISTRADLIPLEYIRELSQLQDRVPPFSSDEAISIIESELGKSVYNAFVDFEPEPIAAASLGQVHRARLHTGEDVVVKVQRPHLETIFNLDLEVSHKLVRFANRFLPGARKYKLEEIYQEFFELLYLEIDYVHEGKNADRFRENFKDYARVVVPKIYWQYSTRRILTLEYRPGTKIDDRHTLEANNINTQELIQLGITCYLKQLLQDGFFQSDPHPGNMAVNDRGEIIFYDFGTMAEVKSMTKDQMVKTFFAVLRKDAETVVDTLVYMGLIEPISDLSSVKRIVAFILDRFREKPVDLREFEQIGNEIYAMFEQQPFRLPPQMTFIIKSITTLDGIARSLDPQYNFLAATKPFVKSIATSQEKGTTLAALARQAISFARYKLTQPNAQESMLRRLESRLEQGELQIRVRSLESDRLLKRINIGIRSLIFACLTGFTLVGGTVLIVASYYNWAIVLFCVSGFWFLFLLKALSELAFQDKLDKLTQNSK